MKFGGWTELLISEARCVQGPIQDDLELGAKLQIKISSKKRLFIFSQIKSGIRRGIFYHFSWMANVNECLDPSVLLGHLRQLKERCETC